MPRDSENPIKGKARVKDDHYKHNEITDGFSERTKAFYDELSVKFPEIRVTGGRRTTSPSGGFSHHHKGDAFDIDKEHTDVFEFLYNEKEGLEMMNRHGMGILDETNPTNMKKTSATGPHFHIGPDTKLRATTKTRFEQFETIQPIQSFYSQNKNFNYNNLSDTSNANTNLYGNHNQETAVPIGGKNPDGTSFRLVLPNQQIAETFIGDVMKEEDKEVIKEENNKASKDRKILEAKQKEQDDRVSKAFEAIGNIRDRDLDSSTRKRSKIEAIASSPIPKITPQRKLPVLSSLFKVK